VRKIVLTLMLALAGCVETVPQAPAPVPEPVPRTQPAPAQLGSKAAVRNFLAVVRRMEPLAERECLARTRNVPCDFQIVVDDRPGQPPNAFQTLDRQGRPIIAFTSALIADARNQDELAFIMGHEAAHHILGHIPRQRETATAGAVLGGLLATVIGVDASGIQTAERIGATVGARTYSKNFELEADQLGTIIAAHAGYNPVRGAAYFSRIPDPGDQFLGTHPPNAERIKVVRQTAARLGY